MVQWSRAVFFPPYKYSFQILGLLKNTQTYRMSSYRSLPSRSSETNHALIKIGRVVSANGSGHTDTHTHTHTQSHPPVFRFATTTAHLVNGMIKYKNNINIHTCTGWNSNPRPIARAAIVLPLSKIPSSPTYLDVRTTFISARSQLQEVHINTANTSTVID